MADIKGVLQKLFPFISAAASLGGPLGTLAANAVGKALGVDNVGSDSSAIASAINGATPEQVLSLQKAEQDFQVQMAQLGFQNIQQLEQIAESDRANARAREISVKDWTPRVLAGGVTLGFFGVLAFMLMRGVPAESRDVLEIMLGSLGTAWAGVMTYYFGSSAGSDEKTKILAAAANPANKK